MIFLVAGRPLIYLAAECSTVSRDRRAIIFGLGHPPDKTCAVSSNRTSASDLADCGHLSPSPRPQLCPRLAL